MIFWLVVCLSLWKNMKVNWDNDSQCMEKPTCSKPPTNDEWRLMSDWLKILKSSFLMILNDSHSYFHSNSWCMRMDTNIDKLGLRCRMVSRHAFDFCQNFCYTRKNEALIWHGLWHGCVWLHDAPCLIWE